MYYNLGCRYTSEEMFEAIEGTIELGGRFSIVLGWGVFVLDEERLRICIVDEGKRKILQYQYVVLRSILVTIVLSANSSRMGVSVCMCVRVRVRARRCERVNICLRYGRGGHLYVGLFLIFCVFSVLVPDQACLNNDMMFKVVVVSAIKHGD